MKLNNSEIWWDILIINNVELAIIIYPVRVICFFQAADFTDHGSSSPFHHSFLMKITYRFAIVYGLHSPVA